MRLIVRPIDLASGSRGLGNSSGFTLVELIVVTIMSSFILLAALEFTTFQQYKSAELTDRIERQTDVMVAMRKIGRDIFLAGYGAPDIPANTVSTVSEILANDIALTTIDAGQSFIEPERRSLNSVFPLVAGSDELIMAGTRYSPEPVAGRFGTIMDGPGLSAFRVALIDGDPFRAGDKMIFVAPNRSSFPEAPAVQIYTASNVVLDPTNANAYTVTLSLPLPSIPASGTEIYGHSPNPSGERLHKVQYAVIDNQNQPTGEPPRGTLSRIRFSNGARQLASAGLERLDILDNVLDLQVQFLVYPCDSAVNAPVWLDDPDRQEFDIASRYPTELARAVHRRGRVIAVRVSVLVLAQRMLGAGGDGVGGTANIHLQPGQTSIVVQNHTVSGINSENEYILRESVYDPVNYRLRDGNWAVRDPASHMNTFNVTGGDCNLVGGG